MYLSEKNTAFADNFFELQDNRIINKFTKKPVGVLVRKIESTNYLCKHPDPTLFQRLKKWITRQQHDWDTIERRVEHQIKNEESLAETMRLLDEATKEKNEM